MRFHDDAVDAEVAMSSPERRARTYETAVARIEEIIRRLDSGQAGLRETLALVKEGRDLVEYCAGELDAVSKGLEELKLDDLVARLDGAGARAMSTFDLLADLPLEVDGYALEGLQANVSSGFERLSTVVHLTGGGLEGVGEDVVYDAEDHVALQEAGPVHARALSGRFTLGEFCELRRLARPVPGGAEARRLAAVPALDLPQRRARPGARAGRAAALGSASAASRSR